MTTVWFLLFERFLLLDLAAPLQVFNTCNAELARNGLAKKYDIHIYSCRGGIIESACGLPFSSQALPVLLAAPVHTSIVVGGPGTFDDEEKSGTKALSAWLSNRGSSISRIGAVCTGTFVLANAGLLAQRRATTHWLFCEALKKLAPGIVLQEEDVYVVDGKVWTCAGVSAGIDMALAMVEADIGREMAMAVAKRLVVFYRRPGAQPQLSSLLAEQITADARISELHDWVRANIEKNISIEMMSERLAMSPRNFARYYLKETGMTPAKAIIRIRLELAGNLMQSTSLRFSAIAGKCGFASQEALRQAFVKQFSISPTEYRRQFTES